MKIKLLCLFLALTFLLPNNQAKASILDSDWFEPGLFCAVAGGAGYMAGRDSGNDMVYAGLGCAAGALVGYLINARYKNKYGTVYQEQIRDLRRSIEEMHVMQAQKAANGEDDQYSIRIQERVEGKRLPNGDILAPTIREKLILPGEGFRVGE